ncbi:MAG: hypothetical protein HY367_00850, partial [Candidatus Aenigmarchaeota archaeon]|nr:hypothetical protein [Candidatus Aenigmarchaeota archaeon]
FIIDKKRINVGSNIGKYGRNILAAVILGTSPAAAEKLPTLDEEIKLLYECSLERALDRLQLKYNPAAGAVQENQLVREERWHIDALMFHLYYPSDAAHTKWDILTPKRHYHCLPKRPYEVIDFPTLKQKRKELIDDMRGWEKSHTGKPLPPDMLDKLNYVRQQLGLLFPRDCTPENGCYVISKESDRKRCD